MKLKLIIVLVVVLGYLAVLACNKKESQTATLTRTAPAPADGTDPPHAVDIAGNVIPEKSATQPGKPIILSKDIDHPQWGEMKPAAAFDHFKHSTDAKYSANGKVVPSCVECHHTDQPSAPGQPFLKKFTRKETLTAKQLEASKEPVNSCRVCHFSPTSEETDEYPPKSVTYPAEMNRSPSGKLTNDVAYHFNCINCHSDAKKRDAKIKAPVTCDDCHVKK